MSYQNQWSALYDVYKEFGYLAAVVCFILWLCLDRQPPVDTPSLYMPGHCAVRLKVTLGRGSSAQEFNQDVILRLDEVQGVFDLLMKNLARNMREVLISYLEDRSSLERFPLMPVLTFKRMRP